MKCLAIKDMKAQVFMKPSFTPSVIDGLRSWEVVVNEGDSLISRFPADFRLYHIADFDPLSGDLLPLPKPVDLGSALDVKKTDNKIQNIQ